MPIDLIKENGFIRKKVRSRLYPTENQTYADYADTAAQEKSLLHSEEQSAGGIGCYVNGN